ncbi:MAG: YsnF/AvaK domain-containing protein [Bacteroidetes bacterium]|nr:YsnF/AvaK domain-containing protein [Bacteroidota bacterium]
MNNDKGIVQKKLKDRIAANRQRSSEDISIPVIEEQLQVEKKVVETGGIRVNKQVHTDDVVVEMPLMHEKYKVERVPVNAYVDELPPAMRQEGNTTIIPVLREVLVKRTILVEELHITKQKIKKQHAEQGVLRTEEVSVDRYPIYDKDAP